MYRRGQESVDAIHTIDVVETGRPQTAHALWHRERWQPASTLKRGHERVSSTNEKASSYRTPPLSMTVTSKGQVTIPKRVRELMEIGPGSVIDFERAPDGRIVLVKVARKARPNRFARVRGHAGKGLSTDEIMALTRGES
jgi:antitoxin PrlF